MIVKSKIIADLTRPNFGGGRVNAVQGDGNTRYAEITLQDGGKPWTPPEGVDVAIAYYQPDGHKGMYNKLADGSAAISVSGSVATVILASQMLTVSGTVQASLVFNDAQLNRLTTFPFSVSVSSNPAAGAQKTEDYIRLQWLEDKLAEYLAEIKASGAFDGRPGDPGRDYDHSPEFTALAAEMAGYQQQVSEDRKQIADAADAVDASAKAAAGSAGIAVGAQQAAEGAATAAAKSAEDAERYAEESQQAVDSLRPVVSQIKDDLSANANADAETRRKLDYLWKLNQGISYQFETDDTEAYSKTVPSGAKLANVESIGGHTESIDSDLVSTVVESVVDRGQNLFDKSTAIQNKYITPLGEIGLRVNTSLSDYISCRDFTDVSINRCGGIVWYGDDGSVLGYVGGKSASIFRTYTKPSGAVRFRFDMPGQLLSDFSTVMCVAGVYTEKTIPSFTTYKTPTTYTIPAAVRSLPGYGWSAGDVYNSIERTDDGWQYVQRVGSRPYQEGDIVTDGMTAYYALEKPVVTDITGLMADFPENLPVEAGGTLTFENAAKLPVPSQIKYLISLAEVEV